MIPKTSHSHPRFGYTNIQKGTHWAGGSTLSATVEQKDIPPGGVPGIQAGDRIVLRRWYDEVAHPEGGYSLRVDDPKRNPKEFTEPFTPNTYRMAQDLVSQAQLPLEEQVMWLRALVKESLGILSNREDGLLNKLLPTKDLNRDLRNTSF